MPHDIFREEFTNADWNEVQDFRCGDLAYQKEVSDWLKAKDEPGVECALSAIKHPTSPSQVWLYRREEDEAIVGFGSLARNEWRWTGGKDPWVPVSIITWCALHSDFQKDTFEPKDRRYSNQLMDDLIGEATEIRSEYPVLGLFVQPDNAEAIKLYQRFKFISEGLTGFTDKETGIYYMKMALVLDQEALANFVGRRKMKRGI